MLKEADCRLPQRGWGPHLLGCLRAARADKDWTDDNACRARGLERLQRRLGANARATALTSAPVSRPDRLVALRLAHAGVHATETVRRAGRSVVLTKIYVNCIDG